MKMAEGLRQHFPQFEIWGFDDVGVFIDWCSLYQDQPVPHTAEEQQSYERALEGMAVWYAHRLTTVYLVSSSNAVVVPRSLRGWPFFEEAVSMFFTDEPRAWSYAIRSADGSSTHVGRSWGRVVQLDSEDTLRRPPPLSPTRFAAALSQKNFFYPSDAEVLCDMYRRRPPPPPPPKKPPHDPHLLSPPHHLHHHFSPPLTNSPHYTGSRKGVLLWQVSA